jgi:DNA-binding MarR family transcriptional regulator
MSRVVETRLVEQTGLVEQWRELQGTYLRTSMAIDRELTHHFGIGLSEFEVLDLVREAQVPDQPCRMKDLSQLTSMTQSALSRVVDRLHKAGLVDRKTCDDDRRALLVGLTEKGSELYDRAVVTHRSLLAEHLP